MGRGRTIVLLHGQPGAAEDWAAVAAQLSPDYQVVVPDRLGYGRTGGRAAGFSANARSVARLLDDLGAAPALVVGHSWAGAVALQMAISYPGHVAALGLVASVAPDEPLSRTDRLMALPVLGMAVTAFSLGTAGRLLATAPARAISRRRTMGDSEMLARATRSWDRPSTWRSFVIEQRALSAELPSLAADLPAVAVPALILVGSADRVVGPGAAHRLTQVLPQASIEVIDGAGHLLPLLRPGPVATALRAMAARIFGEGGTSHDDRQDDRRDQA